MVSEYIDRPVLGIDWICDNVTSWNAIEGYILLAGRRHEMVTRNVVDAEAPPFSGGPADQHTSTFLCPRMESVSSDDGDGQQFETAASDEQSLLRPLTPEERHQVILEAELSDESPLLQFHPWDRKFLQRAQLSDPDISFIYELVLDAAERPSWNRMPIKSFDAKVLWKNLSLIHI